MMATTVAPLGLGMLGLAAALGVGLVFLHGAVAKLRHRALLPGIVANYRLLPGPLVAPVASALPFVELALGAALVAGGQRFAVVPAALLLLTFAGAMAINLRRGRGHIDCGCGRSDLRQPLGWTLVGRNVALAAILLPRLLPTPASGSVEIATGIVGGAAIFLIVLLFNAIGTLAASPLSAKRS